MKRKLVNITDVFFDLDHTLWDFEKNSALAFRYVFEKLNIKIDVELFVSNYSPINFYYWELYRKGKISQISLRYSRLKDTFDLMDFRIEDERINFISEEYVCHLPNFNHLYDGALEILEYLKPNYRLHIITNGFHEIQNNKLKNSNIENYFHTITNSEMAGVKKPDPKIFDFSISSANTEKQKSVMIGDSIEADVLGAINYGMEAIYFNEHKLEVPHNIRQIHNLAELKLFL